MTEWRPSTLLPGWIIGDDGRVLDAATRERPPSVNWWGYPTLKVGGQLLPVHTLVCEAFHGPRPTPKHQVAHGDGDRLNNRASNLRWATPKENGADRIRHSMGLSRSDVEEIRLLSESGCKRRELAERYGLSGDQVRRLLKREAVA